MSLIYGRQNRNVWKIHKKLERNGRLSYNLDCNLAFNGKLWKLLIKAYLTENRMKSTERDSGFVTNNLMNADNEYGTVN